MLSGGNCRSLVASCLIGAMISDRPCGADVRLKENLPSLRHIYPQLSTSLPPGTSKQPPMSSDLGDYLRTTELYAEVFAYLFESKLHAATSSRNPELKPPLCLIYIDGNLFLEFDNLCRQLVDAYLAPGV